ncbi:hypothetical protein ACLOJK_016166 [Asimina triloba]
MPPPDPDAEMKHSIRFGFMGGSEEFFGLGNIQSMPELIPYVGLQLLATPNISAIPARFYDAISARLRSVFYCCLSSDPRNSASASLILTAYNQVRYRVEVSPLHWYRVENDKISLVAPLARKKLFKQFTLFQPMNMPPSAPDDEMMRIIEPELFYQLTSERWSECAGGSDEFFGLGNIQPMPELNPYVGLQLLGTPSISQAEITAPQEA